MVYNKSMTEEMKHEPNCITKDDHDVSDIFENLDQVDANRLGSWSNCYLKQERKKEFLKDVDQTKQDLISVIRSGVIADGPTRQNIINEIDYYFEILKHGKPPGEKSD